MFSVLNLPNNSWMYIEDGGLKADGGVKKIPYGADQKWSFNEAVRKMTFAESTGKNMLGLFKCVRLEDTGVICVDFDDKNITEAEIYEHFPCLKGALMTPGNTKGFHFYVRSEYKGKTIGQSKLNFNGDICFKMFELDGKDWTGELKSITMDEFSGFLKEDVTDTESVSSESAVSVKSVSSLVSSSGLKPITQEERQMLDLIPQAQYSDYLPWTMFISACKNSWSDGIEVADYYSSKVRGYEGFDDVEKRATMNQTKGYLVNLVKKHNFQAYRVILQERFFDPKNMFRTPFDIAEFLMSSTDVVVKVHDQLYYYENCYWHRDNTKDRNHVKRILITFIRDIIKGHLKKAYQDLGADVESDTGKRRVIFLTGLLTTIGKPDNVSSIISEFNTYTLNSDIKFDCKPDLYCFKNCAIDLRTNQPRAVQKEDYITMYCDYDWSPSPKDKIKLVEDLFADILPNEEIRKCKISTLRCGMIGRCFEYFVMESGSGGNGKDVILNLYKAALTSTYFYKGSAATLLDPKIKSGGNPEVANMHKKRYVVFSEPPEKATLNMGVLKDMTGGGDINARSLYSTDCVCTLENITSFICNARPNIGGDIGDAELRRFINIPYTQVYSTNEEKIARGAKRANSYYKTSEFHEEYKLHLINYLLTFNYTEPYIPRCIRDETEHYLFGADNTSSFFSDKVEFTEDSTDYVTLRDLTDIYKEQFGAGSKDYRSMTTKKMLEIFKRNVIWRDKVTDCFHEGLCQKLDKSGKKISKTHVFLKMRLIVPDASTDDV